MSGRVSGGCFENGVSGAGQMDRTPTGHFPLFCNKTKDIGCPVGVSGACCQATKVCLSVRGGFFRNPLTGHSGHRARHLVI